MIGFLIFIVMLNDVFDRCYIGILSSQIYKKIPEMCSVIAFYMPRGVGGGEKVFLLVK